MLGKGWQKGSGQPKAGGSCHQHAAGPAISYTSRCGIGGTDRGREQVLFSLGGLRNGDAAVEHSRDC